MPVKDYLEKFAARVDEDDRALGGQTPLARALRKLRALNVPEEPRWEEPPPPEEPPVSRGVEDWLSGISPPEPPQPRRVLEMRPYVPRPSPEKPRWEEPPDIAELPQTKPKAIFVPMVGMIRQMTAKEKETAPKWVKAFASGVGDVISGVAGAARWLGYEDVGEGLAKEAERFHREYTYPDTLGEFEFADLLNPEFYATKIVRTVPFALSLAPLAMGGFYAGAGIAGAAGLGTIWTTVIGGLAGAALSRPVESAMEAGSQYDDAIARGKTEAEAKKEADEVFKKNMTLAGADAWEIAIALAPTPKWVPTALVKGGMVRTVKIGGKMVIVGLSEGGEEVYQDMIQRRARGEEWQLDPIAKEVFALGAVMGLGMGLGGDVISSIVSRSKGKMSPALKRDFDRAVSGFEDEGFRTDQAELRALDVIAKTAEGEKMLSEVIGGIEGKVPPTAEAMAGARAELVPKPVTPEVTKPDITPSMPDSYVQARKRPDGKWQLFFTGTRNEVFPNELFTSVSDAKMAFKVAKAKSAIPKAVTPGVQLRERLFGGKTQVLDPETMTWVDKPIFPTTEALPKPGAEVTKASVIKGLREKGFEGTIDRLEHGRITLEQAMGELKGTLQPEVIERTNLLTANTADVIADIKARGFNKQTGYGQFVKARNLKPEVDMKEFSRIYDSVSAKTFAPEVAIPTAEAGMPEAGLQPSMIPEEVAGKRVFPKGKGVVTQISMDDLAKLRDLEAKELGTVLGEATSEEMRMAQLSMEQIGIKEYLASEPAAKLTNLIKKAGWYKGEISNLTIPQYQKLTGKETPLPNVLTPDKKHVRWEYVLDDVATEMGYKSSDELRDAIQNAGEMKAKLADIEYQLRMGVVEEPADGYIGEAIRATEQPIVEPMGKAPAKAPPPEKPPAPVTYPNAPEPSDDLSKVMPDLQKPDDIIRIASTPDAGKRLANLPVIKNIMKVLNPAAVAHTPAEKYIVIRAHLFDEVDQKTAGIMALLNRLGMAKDVFGGEDSVGLIKSGKLQGKSLLEIATYPDKYDLTTEQKAWLDQADQIEKAKLQALRRNDIEVNELEFEEGGRYAGRRVFAKTGKDGEMLDVRYVGAAPRRPGAKVSFEKPRYFENSEDAIKAGYRYLPYDESLALNVKGAYRRIGDKQVADWLLTQVPWRTTGAPEELVLAAEAAKSKLNTSRQMLAALNRAIRGDRGITPKTFQRASGVYPEVSERLSQVVARVQQGIQDTGDEVKSLTNELKVIVDNNRLSYSEAVSTRARAREKAMRVGWEEGAVPAPAFAGKIFTGEEAKDLTRTIMQEIDPNLSRALTAVNKVNAVSRYFMLSGDMSPMMIQLIFLAGENPKIYGKAFSGALRAMFSTKFQSRYIANNKQIIDMSPNLIIPVSGSTEFTEAMARGGFFRMKPIKWVGAGLEFGQRFFETSLTVAGIELKKAYLHTVKNAKDNADLDQWINEFRGLTSSARIGVPASQRQQETAALLAPRYNRAIAGLFSDVFRGGIRGHRSRIALARGFTALAAMALAISVAKGEDWEEITDHFNPNSPNFFTWEIAGQHVGPGSKARAVIRLFAQSISNPDDLLQLSMDNPVLRFVRSNLSPVVGNSIDILTGRNYIGEPVRPDILTFGKEVFARNLMPLTLESILFEGGNIGERLVRGAAQFLGMRSYPLTEWDILTNLRKRYAQSDFGTKYEELNGEQMRELETKHFDLKDQYDKAKAESAEKGKPEEKFYYNAVKDFRDVRDKSMEDLATAYKAGKINKKQYDSERGYIRPYYSGAMAALWKARETLDSNSVQKQEKWIAENQKPEDKAVDEYLARREELISKSELPRDWDAIEKELGTFLEKYPQITREYVLRNQQYWISDLPPNAREIELQRAKGIEDGTWWQNYQKPVITSEALKSALDKLRGLRK